MITIFNRATLMKDNNAEAISLAWSTLKENNIPYEIKTIKNHSSFGRNLHYRESIQFHGGGMGSVLKDEMQYVYCIYVKKSDLAKARKICGI